MAAVKTISLGCPTNHNDRPLTQEITNASKIMRFLGVGFLLRGKLLCGVFSF
jgi:hypothetical protein